MLKILGLAACLGLCGCASAAQVAAEDDALCQSYGAAPGSPAIRSVPAANVRERLANGLLPFAT